MSTSKVATSHFSGHHAIPDDPWERLTPEMKEALANNEIPIDVHCHLFSRDVLPRGRGLARLSRLQNCLLTVAHLVNRWGPLEMEVLSNLEAFLAIGKLDATSSCGGTGQANGASRIAQVLESHHQEPWIAVPLMMDMEQGIPGPRDLSYDAQAKALNDIACQAPGRYLPFLAVDPNRSDCYQKFLEHFQTPEWRFFGIKIYPSLDYLPTATALMKVFRVCEEKGIPVTAHCMPGGVFATTSLIRRLLRLPCGLYENNHPKHWRAVLGAFPRLRLNLAHFGGAEELRKWMRCDDDSWSSHIVELMREFDHVYADLAFTLSSLHDMCCDARRLLEFLTNRMAEPDSPLGERLLYGTDFYMLYVNNYYSECVVRFRRALGDALMQQIACRNPRRFLLPPAPAKARRQSPRTP